MPTTRERLSGEERGIHVTSTITIARPADEIYRAWRDLERLPQWIPHLASVRAVDARRSHWRAHGPSGYGVEWDAVIINEIPNKLIGWSSTGDAELASAGSVRFRPAPGDRGTEVRVRLQYDPPFGGRFASWVAWLAGRDPSRELEEGLRRLKEELEAGHTDASGH